MVHALPDGDGSWQVAIFDRRGHWLSSQLGLTYEQACEETWRLRAELRYREKLQHPRPRRQAVGEP